MKESETDEILFSNNSYLKQFRLNKMGAEVVISDIFLISKFLKGLTHCALKICKMSLTSFISGRRKTIWNLMARNFKLSDMERMKT